MKLSDFDYDLPKELIAQKPVRPRDSSRLMVLGRNIEHRKFHDILQYLEKGDVLVINSTKVIPAKLSGAKPTGGKVDVVLTRKIKRLVYEATLGIKRPKVGMVITIKDNSFTILSFSNSLFTIKFNKEPDLRSIGKTPLPPYIKQEALLEDYQTVYARESGSAAAPTAGLHFTEELLKKIRMKGVEIAKIILHIGPGTFMPVKTEVISEHIMHREHYSVSSEAAKAINERKGRLIAVGTTSIRCLESSADEKGRVEPGSGWTDLFIYPGYRFRCRPDALITNFHLPKSTLIMLVSAYAGKERVFSAYQAAIKEKYRFYSFGDAMLIFSV